MDRTEVLVVCTGNAARSVMAGYMLEHLAVARGAPLVVTTAGTHAVCGQPMAARTFAAMSTIPELAGVAAGAHRSRQLDSRDADFADLVVAMEADHVRFLRRHHPRAAGRSATIRRLARDLPAGPSPLASRVAAMQLSEVTLDDDEDVADPGGRDEAAYVACAAELWSLCCELVARL